MPTPIGTERLYQFPAKTAPIGADILYVGDSAANYNEVQSTITQILIGGGAALLSGADFIGTVTVPIPTDLTDVTDAQVIPYQSVQITASAASGAKAATVFSTTANLDATYAPGTDMSNPALGATLTANANGYFDPDGTLLPTEDQSIIVSFQTDRTQNGIYILTTEGDLATPYVLTRRDDFDNSPNGQVLNGCIAYNALGTQYGNTFFVFVSSFFTTGLINVGIDPIEVIPVVENIPPPPEEDFSGTATLVSGSVDVDYQPIDANSLVFLSVQNIIGTPGFLSYIPDIGTGFTINSTSSTDDSDVNWLVVQKSTLPPTFGDVFLFNGNATVDLPVISSTSIIMLSIQNPVSSNGKIIVNSTTPGTGFTITSGYSLDQSLIGYSVYDIYSPYLFGTATLSAGTATVSYPIATGDVVLITVQVANGTLGNLSVANRVNGTSFDIVSNSSIDTSIVGWVVYPAGSSVPHGIATLAAGSAIVANGEATTTSIIMLSGQSPSMTFGNFAVGTRVPHTTFQIASNYGADTSQVGYVILNQ